VGSTTKKGPGGEPGGGADDDGLARSNSGQATEDGLRITRDSPRPVGTRSGWGAREGDGMWGARRSGEIPDLAAGRLALEHLFLMRRRRPLRPPRRTRTRHLPAQRAGAATIPARRESVRGVYAYNAKRMPRERPAWCRRRRSCAAALFLRGQAEAMAEARSGSLVSHTAG